VDGIFLFTWKIFGLHGKNNFQRFHVHESLVHHSQVHYSNSCVHMVAVLQPILFITFADVNHFGDPYLGSENSTQQDI
jgi:hypothetical protein